MSTKVKEWFHEEKDTILTDANSYMCSQSVAEEDGFFVSKNWTLPLLKRVSYGKKSGHPYKGRL